MLQKLSLVLTMLQYSTWLCSQQPGVIVDSNRCVEGKEQYYALYLPQDFEIQKEYPVIFFFDPMARGRLPLEQYHAIADTFGIIMACSNNSKNGPYEDSQIAAKAMIGDVMEKFNIDTSSIILSGFSGASRFSYYYATIFAYAQGVIGCGASLPAMFIDFKSLQHFNYTGIAGNQGFNYVESLRFRELSAKWNKPIQWISFEGGHTWPPYEVYKRAVRQQLALLLAKQGEYNDPMVQNYILEEERNAKLCLEDGKLIEAIWCLENIVAFLPQNKSWLHQQKSDSIKSLLDFEKQQKDFAQAIRLEDTLKSKYHQEIINLGIQESKKKALEINEKKWKRDFAKVKELRKKRNPYYNEMVDRVLGSLRLSIWMKREEHMQAQQFELAYQWSKLLLCSDPEGPYFLLMAAEVLSAMGKRTEASLYFDLAFEKGFEDHIWIDQNPYLSSLRE